MAVALKVPAGQARSNRVFRELLMNSSRISQPATGWINPPPVRSQQRVICTALVLLVGGVTSAMFSAVGYHVGRKTESDLRFFEPRRAPTLDEACIACPIEYALHSSEKNDVIFVGDSTCRVSVDPKRFQKLTGLSAYNLASEGGVGPTGFLITAEAYLAKHPAPRIVVMSMSPLAFESSVEEIVGKKQRNMLERFQANYGPEVPGFVPWSESARYFVKRGALATWLATPQFIHPDHAQDVRDLPMIGSSDSFRSYQRGVGEQRGYAPLPGLHGVRQIIEFPGAPVKIDPEWDRDVRRLMDDCDMRGIPLIVRLSPMPRDLSDIKDFKPLEPWFKSLRQSHRNVIVGSPLFLWYDAELCWDQIHLNTTGGSAFLAVIADDVRKAMGDR